MSYIIIRGKFSKINRLIVESSIVFVSIFSTVGLIIGSGTGQFKNAYMYFGYMMYFSIPFILAIFWGTLSILSVKKKKQIADLVSYLSIASFFAGLSTLIYLACMAAGTVMLPNQFIFILPISP